MLHRGLAIRHRFADAIAWIQTKIEVLPPEHLESDSAVGRVLADAVTSRVELPTSDCAGIDGYALRAADTEGADAYAPVYLILVQDTNAALPPLSALSIVAGWQVPDGADAILPIENADVTAGMLHIVRPMARGEGVLPHGVEAPSGVELLGRGRRIGPEDLALLKKLEVDRLSVIRQPLVRIVAPGPKPGGPDALTPMLRSLVARDGGIAQVPTGSRARSDLADVLSQECSGTDVVMIAGRSGAGSDDIAAAAVAQCGGIFDLHGVAMQPASSIGLGRIAQSWLILLPGEPLACFTGYELLARLVIRRMAGLPTRHKAYTAPLAKKIVSSIGLLEAVPVRLFATGAMPLSTPGTGGITSAVQAHGFVTVPEGSEGFAPGTLVDVHVFREEWDAPAGDHWDPIGNV